MHLYVAEDALLKSLIKMYILKKSLSPEDFSIETTLFDGQTSIVTSIHSSNQWQRNTKNNYLLTYTLSLIGTEAETKKVVIKYHRILAIECILDNITNDVLEIMDIKEDMYASMIKFITINSQPYTEILKLRNNIYPAYFTDEDMDSYRNSLAEREIASIERATVSVALEELSDTQRKFIEKITPHNFNINTSLK